MKEIKFKCEGNFLGSKMAKTILTDWGAKQIGPLSQVGHEGFLITNEDKIKQQTESLYKNIIKITDTDMNPIHILAISGTLATFGQNRQKLFYPRYLVEITVANCIAILVFQLTIGNKKSYQKISKVSCIECMRYFGAFNSSALQNNMIDISKKRGQNILQGGAPFYGIYHCQEGLLAVGNLEYKFYEEMVKNIGLNEEQENYFLQNQLSMEKWAQMRKILQRKFKQNTAAYWQNLLKDKDTCVTEVKNFLNLPKNYIHPILIKPKL